MKALSWTLVSLCLLQGSTALARDLNLQACQRLKSSIESYDAKRRAGGSVAQMERWKRARQHKKDEYDRRRCRQYRRQLTGL